MPEFIIALETAQTIRRYGFTYTRPNPIDQRPFIKLLEGVTADVNGNSGKTEFVGDALDKDELIEMTRAVASTGNTAFAKVTTAENSRPITRKLNEDTPVVISSEELITAKIRLELRSRMRGQYQRINNLGDG